MIKRIEQVITAWVATEKTVEVLQDVDELIGLVRRMRVHQKRRDNSDDSYDIVAARSHERAVDEAMKKFPKS